MLQSVTHIQGARVLLRPFQNGDAEEGHRVWTPELRHMYGGSRTAPPPPPPAPRPQPSLPAPSEDTEHRFAIEADARYIGHAGLRPLAESSANYRIGIVNPEYWGRGYGTEVTRLLLRYAFETLGLHRVQLRVTAYNTRARRCYEKCGFRVEGVERQSFQVDGEWQDDVLMAILKEEWEANGDGGACDGTEVVLRSYRSADHAEVCALWETCDLHGGPSDTAEALERKLRVGYGAFLIAEAEGRIVGTAMGNVDRATAWVNRVAVHPDYRRRGLARRLMRELEHALVALGARYMNLLTHERNEAAQALYASLGYTAWPQILYMNKEATVEGNGGGD